MWKKEDAKPQGVAEGSTAPVTAAIGSTQNNGPVSSPSIPVSPRAAACISQGIRIKGEVTGSEDLFVDGSVDGKLNIINGSLTIGPNGSVKADVSAREVIVRGKVEGNVTARDKVALWSTGQVTGEVRTDRLAIEDGALLRGKVEAGRPPVKTAETKAAAAGATASKTSDSTSLSSGTVAN
ncbi:MAG TPA: polymer-forming cytoskeletal protein [Candidatus Acidoferrum sp.]|nr:polymer-forming cytoskeletal protein [Candidatus Acidoferrum sp.]